MLSFLHKFKKRTIDILVLTFNNDLLIISGKFLNSLFNLSKYLTNILSGQTTLLYFCFSAKIIVLFISFFKSVIYSQGISKI